jgi:hypothetical protein
LYYKWEIHVHVAGVATLLLATLLSAKATLLAAIPPMNAIVAIVALDALV